MADIVKTIGSGGDFPDGQAWADDINTAAGGFYSDGDRAIGELLETQTSGGDTIVFKPSAVSPNKIAGAILRPASGQGHGGDPTAGVAVESTTTTGRIIDIGTGTDYDVTIEDLIIRSTNVSASRQQAIGVRLRTLERGTYIVRRCFALGTGLGATNAGPTGFLDERGELKVIRCVISKWSNPTTLLGLGGSIAQWLTGGLLSNCSIDSCQEYGVTTPSTSVVVQNNILLGNGTDFNGAPGAASSKNMSSDATAPGIVTYHNQVRGDIWTDPDNQDWTLKPGTDAIGNGENLGSTYEENIDITGKLVTDSWDLGAYQSVVQLPPGIPVSGARRLHMIGF